SQDFWKSYTPFVKRCRGSAITMSIFSPRWCDRVSVRATDLPGTLGECVLGRPLPIIETSRPAQVKAMINKKTTSLIFLALISLYLLLPTGAYADVSRLRNISDASPSIPAVQSKTVVLDVTAIAERVNEVVVNVRSTSEGGENLGSGFIIDQRGLIATNFHLISNAEPRRGSSQRGPEPKGAPKLAGSVTVTLHDGRQFPASIKGYDEATDISLLEIVPTG